MKAIVLERPGSTGNFVYKEVPRPVIALNEVLVKVEYISINPVGLASFQSSGLVAEAKFDAMKLRRSLVAPPAIRSEFSSVISLGVSGRCKIRLSDPEIGGLFYILHFVTSEEL